MVVLEANWATYSLSPSFSRFGCVFFLRRRISASISDTQKMPLSSSFPLVHKCRWDPLMSFCCGDFAVCAGFPREVFEWQVAIIGCYANAGFNVCDEKIISEALEFKPSIEYIPYLVKYPGPRRRSQSVRHKARTPRIEAMQPNTIVLMSPALH